MIFDYYDIDIIREKVISCVLLCTAFCPFEMYYSLIDALNFLSGKNLPLGIYESFFLNESTVITLFRSCN